MKYEFFIAKRYLLSKKETGFITVISLISVLGVTVGVAALIVVLSVFNGFNGLVTSILVSFDPHIRITMTPHSGTTDAQQLLRFLAEDHSISGAGPYVSGKAMIISRNQSKVVFVRGLDPGVVDKISGVQQKLVLGELQFGSVDKRSIVLGLTLADRLGAICGDSIYLVSPAGSEDALLGFGAPIVQAFQVTGIYESDNKDYDAMYAFMSLTSAQSLFRRSGSIDGYEIRLQDIGASEQFKHTIQSRFGSAVVVQSWYDLHKDLYTVMQIERWGAYIILCLIIGVASFNLLGSLTMSVIAKTRDIGILKTMGSTNKEIVRIFRLEGFLVGIVGTLVGSTIGILIVYLQKQYSLFPLDPTVYIIPAIPVELQWMDFIAVGIAAIGLSLLATFLPSRRASAILPSEAIRWE